MMLAKIVVAVVLQARTYPETTKNDIADYETVERLRRNAVAEESGLLRRLRIDFLPLRGHAQRSGSAQIYPEICTRR